MKEIIPSNLSVYPNLQVLPFNDPWWMVLDKCLIDANSLIYIQIALRSLSFAFSYSYVAYVSSGGIPIRLYSIPFHYTLHVIHETNALFEAWL